jgi:hypothetical protein
VAITRIGNPAIADVRGVNFRNIIINGGMDIAQRGTSVTGVNTNNGFPTLDRFLIGFTSSGTYDMSQSSDVPSGKGFSSSLKIKCASTDTSIASGDEFLIQQRIEAQNLQYLKYGTSNAENLTLSFYAKAVNKTGTYCVHLQKNDSTSAYFYSEFSVTTSWQKFSISIPANSVVQSSGGAISNDNGIGIIVMFFLMNGSSTQGTDAKDQWSTTNHRTSSNQVNFLDSTSNEFYITGVQLEAGQVASDFEFLPFDYQLRSCQRYYYQTYDYGTAFATATYTGVPQRFTDNGSNFTSLQMFHPVPMRSAPSIVVYNPNTGGTGSGTTDSNVNKDIAAIQISQKYAHLHASDTTINKSASIRCHITANSEL